MIEAPSESPALTHSSPTLRILVVEDQQDAAVSMALMMRMYGYCSRIAVDGPTALQVAMTENPDVVLLDIGLPGMDGWEIARRLGEATYRKRPLLIAVTAFGDEDSRQKSAEAGIDLHLVKPIEPNALRSILSKFQRILK